MANVDDNKLEEFLKQYKTRREIEKEFKLSNTESFHLLKRYKKMGDIETKNLTGCIKQKGVIVVYRWKTTKSLD